MQRNPYWPLNGPSFFSVLRFCRCVFLAARRGGRLRAKFRGADGKPTTESSKVTGEAIPSVEISASRREDCATPRGIVDGCSTRNRGSIWDFACLQKLLELVQSHNQNALLFGFFMLRRPRILALNQDRKVPCD